MKIGSKLVLFYTLMTFGVAMFIIIVFYVTTSKFIDNVFDVNLTDKVYLTAQYHFKKDEVDEKAYEVIQKDNRELLPRAHELVINCKDSLLVRDSVGKYLDRSEQRELYAGNPILFARNGQRGAALCYHDNLGDFVVVVMANNGYGYKIQQHILYLSLILLFVSIAVILVLGRVYANRILYPLKHILENLKNIRGNNIDVRLEETGNKDELDALVHNLNDMLDRICEAFRSEKSFVSAASHELSNPLTAIQGECEITLMKDRDKTLYKESLQRIYSESQRMSQLIKHLLFLSRHDDDLSGLESSDLDLVTFLSDLSQSTERVVFTDETEYRVLIQANPYLMQVAIQNFLNNATKYSQEEINLRLRLCDRHPVIEIEDYGIGIPKDEIPFIFQSFYRASNTRDFSGNGIGMALSAKILNIYHAKVTIESEVNKFTRFVITFA
jgi:two-component system, OmpR family, sensor histidine kinase ArlS